MMRDRLEQGDPWMGIVNHHCRDGDRYRVDAHVTLPKAQVKGEIELTPIASRTRLRSAPGRLVERFD